jgi:hypothetical protein
MANGFKLLGLHNTSSPVLLFGVPQFGGFGERVAPRSGAFCEVLSLDLLVVVLEAVVLGSASWSAYFCASFERLMSQVSGLTDSSVRAIDD